MTKEYDFSILIPTRQRRKELRRLFNSIVGKTKNPDNLEVICMVDYDDPESLQTLQEFLPSIAFDLKVVIRKQSENLSDDYYNAMASMARGKYIWVLNDDCQIETKHWDEIVLNKMKNIPLEACYIDINDTTRNFNNNGHFSCFPMLSREAINTLGYFFNPAIRTWGADKYLHHVYFQAGCDIPMLEVNVIHHREACDQNFEKMKRVFKEDKLDTIEKRINFNKDIFKLFNKKRKKDKCDCSKDCH